MYAVRLRRLGAILEIFKRADETGVMVFERNYFVAYNKSFAKPCLVERGVAWKKFGAKIF